MKLVKTNGVRIYSRFAANSARIAQIFVSSVLDAGDRSTKITAYHFNAWTSEWRSQVTNIKRFIENFVKLDIVLPNVWCALTFRGRELGSVVYLTYLVGEKDSLAGEWVLHAAITRSSFSTLKPKAPASLLWLSWNRHSVEWHDQKRTGMEMLGQLS